MAEEKRKEEERLAEEKRRELARLEEERRREEAKLEEESRAQLKIRGIRGWVAVDVSLVCLEAQLGSLWHRSFSSLRRRLQEERRREEEERRRREEEKRREEEERLVREREEAERLEMERTLGGKRDNALNALGASFQLHFIQSLSCNLSFNV